jgi:hypothetical protein
MDERARQGLDGIARLLERTAPWLSEIGSWIFGGLVAVNLVMIPSASERGAFLKRRSNLALRSSNMAAWEDSDLTPAPEIGMDPRDRSSGP